jgi:hypothetical protein
MVTGHEERLMDSTPFDDSLLARQVKILKSGVKRVVGRVGVVMEIAHARRPSDGPLQIRITVDVPGHGEVIVDPADIEVVS